MVWLIQNNFTKVWLNLAIRSSIGRGNGEERKINQFMLPSILTFCHNYILVELTISKQHKLPSLWQDNIVHGLSRKHYHLEHSSFYNTLFVQAFWFGCLSFLLPPVLSHYLCLGTLSTTACNIKSKVVSFAQVGDGWAGYKIKAAHTHASSLSKHN